MLINALSLVESIPDIYIFVRLNFSLDLFMGGVIRIVRLILLFLVRLKKIVRFIYGVIRTVRLNFVRLIFSLDLFMG